MESPQIDYIHNVVVRKHRIELCLFQIHADTYIRCTGTYNLPTPLKAKQCVLLHSDFLNVVTCLWPAMRDNGDDNQIMIMTSR